MCGIIGYTGHREALPLILEGLRCLEYRGYDSAGVAILNTKGVKMVRATGKVAVLAEKCDGKNLTGTSGIGHTRWATHGAPSEKNTHPHRDCDGNFFVVHNGIIENYQELKAELIKKGHHFASETDSEVIAHLTEEMYKKYGTPEDAVRHALPLLYGTYGLAIVSKREPEKIIVARMGAPIALGLGNGENFIASDATPLLAHTKRVLYLMDGELAVLTKNDYNITTLKNRKVKREAETISWSSGTTEKKGFPHFTLKEIMEGPDALRDTIRGRLVPEKGLVKLGGVESVAKRLANIERVQIVGCGTASYAGLIGEYLLEEYGGLEAKLETAAEFRYRKPRIDRQTLLIAVSQSGETADTREAIREAKEKGALTFGIVNVIGSTIAREVDAGLYTHAGPEVSVLSTKAFIAQVASFVLVTLALGRARGLSFSQGKQIAEELETLPEKIATILKHRKHIEKITRRYARFKNFYFVGRKYNFPIALEGALKLKEASYLHAEGLPAGELKHGPLAMIDKTMPTIAIATKGSVYEKMVSTIREIKARSGPVIAIATEGNTEIEKHADDMIFVPDTIECLSPILSVVPLQLFAYYLTVAKGLDPDRPRNLAKSVTVE